VDRIETLSPTNLDGEVANFLKSFRGEVGIPIYQKGADGIYRLVKECGCPYGRRGEFKQAPFGLWLGGVAGFVLTKHGICVVPDERRGGRFKATCQGWSDPLEGPSPLVAMLREFWEEVVVFDLERRVEVRLPNAQPHNQAKLLQIELSPQDSVTHGSLKLLHVNENPDEGNIEFVHVWDLCEYENPITIVYDDQFYKGGVMGVPVFVMNDIGRIIGWFSGQQGFLEFENMGLHPVVKNSLLMLGDIMHR
jgi:hypothetical protein